MNKKSKTISLAGVGLVSTLVLVLFGVRAISSAPRSAGHGQTAAPVKKASEQFKNIQVLADLPADQLYPAMHFMSESLGVECVDCHVGVPGRVDGEKDDKQMKLTARKMIKMTMEINKANFGGNANRTVTCFTCHRGARQPVATPVITDAAPSASLAESQPTLEQILDKYLRAVGGAEAIQKVTTIEETGNIESVGSKTPFEIFAKVPNKRVYLRHAASGATTSSFDGTTGWLRTADGMVREMTATEVFAERIDADSSFPLQVKQAFQQIRVLSTEIIGDKKTYSVIARVSGGAPVKLYFDVQTGLLLRIIRYTDVGLGQMPVQTDFSDYRETSGIKMPYRWTITAPASTVGRYSVQIERIQPNVRIDDSRFAKPSAEPAVK